MFKKCFFTFFVLLPALATQATQLLIPMDNTQKNHLKAYGITYWILQNNQEAEWLLNYRGGSFMCGFSKTIQDECSIRGVSVDVISEAQAISIRDQIADPSVNMDIIKLSKAPKVAVYAPKTNQPWDDAVTLVLTYAEIPYDLIYDEEVLKDVLPKYDWLHLHHEDFTGQYGKFWASYQNAEWYRTEVAESEKMAKAMGFAKVSQMKLAVAKKIRDFVAGGGYLFAMCSAPDSYDIALAAEGVDICQPQFDGDAMDPQAQSKLDFSKTFAFENFTISTNPYEYEISSIDAGPLRRNIRMDDDYFALFEFSAKWDPVPTMLCQDHERIIKGFMGQTTSFRNDEIKSSVLIMGENKALGEVRYIHGEYGKGTWTFLGGHDPEDYTHFVYDPPTELDLFPNSPGYRLILNNVLFPAAKKKKQKT
ncbi:MAG: asparagine synthetase B [Bacteroidetes bacterium HGW-Bacteroidetes-6]|nr:MAG: asparagine synthetase B [Bacteroidetes bacterium HGW-Bacteroidetes-6]